MSGYFIARLGFGLFGEFFLVTFRNLEVFAAFSFDEFLVEEDVPHGVGAGRSF